MREIKFRGMDINGNWHHGNLAILKQDIDSSRKAGCYISNSAGMPFAYDIRPETIGQFTGLHDKNGKEIYDGDIVVTDYGTGPVEYSGVGFSVDCDSISEYWETSQSIEVIGNIHENEGLLA